MKRLIWILFLPLVITACQKTVGVAEPELVFSNDSLIFRGDQERQLYISTNPASECSFRVISYPDWVKVSPDSGIIRNDIQSLTITSNLSSLVPGTYSGNLTLMTSLGKHEIQLKGIIGPMARFIIADSLLISPIDTSVLLSIKNNGNVALSFTGTVSNGYISLVTTAGSVGSGNDIAIRVRVDRSTMITGTYYSNITFHIGEEIVNVGVRIINYIFQKLMLPADVMDAEYSKTRNLLVFVTEDPSRVYTYDPVAGTTSATDLLYVPICVSVSTDGKNAVVAHDGHLTYVDLVGMSVINTFSVSCYPSDVVLGDNHWAYVFPKNVQWTHFSCIDLSLPGDNEVMSTGEYIFGGNKARLHPSGKYIYAADNGLSPADIEKYDIQTGQGNFLYDSPYHGDYPFNGDLWFSEDGQRIFTKGKTVVKLSEVRANDMLYNGSITLGPSNTSIMWLDHSAARNNLYVISSTDSYFTGPNKPFIYVFNADNLVAKDIISLESYFKPDGHGGTIFYDPVPYFVFSTSAGDKILVLTKSNGSGLAHDWAIQTISIQ